MNDLYQLDKVLIFNPLNLPACAFFPINQPIFRVWGGWIDSWGDQLSRQINIEHLFTGSILIVVVGSPKAEFDNAVVVEWNSIVLHQWDTGYCQIPDGVMAVAVMTANNVAITPMIVISIVNWSPIAELQEVILH